MPLHLENLHAALTRSQKSQADLARQLGVSPATISRWFNGEGEPETLKRLQELASALQTTLPHLVGEDAAMTDKEKMLLRAYRDVSELQGDAAIALLSSMRKTEPN